MKKFSIIMGVLISAVVLYSCSSKDEQQQESSQSVESQERGDQEVYDSIAVETYFYRFTPNPIVVKKGHKIHLQVTAHDIAHRFIIEAFDIDRTIEKDASINIEFTPTNSGEYEISSTALCSNRPYTRRGILKVQR
ncbi:MAG: cupredoxin domain-containing protein [Chlamydiota bacterium]